VSTAGKKSKTVLRALEPADIKRTLKWHNDPKLYKTMGGTFQHVSQRAEEEWLRARSVLSSRELNLAICVARDMRHIGNLYLREVNWTARNGEIQMFIGERGDQGRGYGKDALLQLIAYAFGTLGLERLYLFLMADNARALALYQGCGFVVEGRMKNHAFKDGEFKDVLVMGLCVSSQARKTK
jgi:RimJ/RimL family protein N-acetyltransferase